MGASGRGPKRSKKQGGGKKPQGLPWIYCAVVGGGVAVLAAWWGLATTPTAQSQSGVKPARSRGNKQAETPAAEHQRRASGASALLDELKEAGLKQHVALDFRMTEHAGLGVFLAEPVKAGASIFELPSSLMLKGAIASGGADAADNQATKATGLSVALAKERRAPSSKHMALYIKSMPNSCPHNLVTRPRADSTLAEQSIHKWKVQLLREETAIFKSELPDASVKERKWAMCMMLSRALIQAGHGAVMMPFTDLLNHGDASRHQNTREHDVVVAARDLAAGEEVTFSYVESPSKARLLTSFGFSGGAPAASLVAAGLPQRDAAWLAEHGCSTVDRTDFYANKEGRVTQDGVRDALRCVRLKLYTAEEAAWALDASRRHLDQPFEALPRDASSDPMLAAVLAKDKRVVGNTAMMCFQAQTRDQMEAQAQLLNAASEDLRSAIMEETLALMACHQYLQKAHEEVDKRLRTAQ